MLVGSCRRAAVAGWQRNIPVGVLHIWQSVGGVWRWRAIWVVASGSGVLLAMRGLRRVLGVLLFILIMSHDEKSRETVSCAATPGRAVAQEAEDLSLRSTWCAVPEQAGHASASPRARPA
jgi:hypothetical protein